MSTHEPSQTPRIAATGPASRVHLRLAATCFFLYAFYTNFGFWSDNEQIRYALTKAIVEDGSFRVDRYREFLGLDKALCRGHFYSEKPPGSSLLIIPQYILARTVARQRLFQNWTAMVRAWLVICLSVCLYAAVSVAVLYEVLGLLGVKRGRVGYCYAYAAGTLAFPYATVMLGAQFTAPLVILATWFALKGERRSDLFWLGVMVGLTFVTCYHAILLVGWLIPLRWLTLKSKRRIGWALAPAITFLLLQLAYNWVCFGGPLNISNLYWVGGPARATLGLPSPRQLYWATFSPWKGMFYYSPWLLFYFVGLGCLWREQRVWAAYLAVAAACFMGFMLLSNQPDGHKWWVGDDFGARKFVPVIPIIAMGAAVGIAKLVQRAKTALARRIVLTAAVCAVAWGVFANSLGALTSPVTYELTREHGGYCVQRHPHEPKVELKRVTNPLLDITLKGLLAFGSNNVLTQLWQAADVSANPSAGQWALNMASNCIPIAFALLIWWGPIQGRWRGFRQTRGLDEAGPEPASQSATVTRLAISLLVGYLLFRFWLLAAYCTTVISYPFEVCAAEGILLNQGLLLARGASIYPPVGGYPFLISHFPPVLPLVLAAGIKLCGIAFWPGRLIAFGSAAAVAVAVYSLASKAGREKAAGIAAALLLATSPWFALSSVQVCPDTLALALSLAGVCVVAHRQGAVRTAAAGVLLALAVLTRQTQVAGLVAVCWWLWSANRRACWRVAIVWLTVVGLAVAAAEIASNGGFHRHVVAHTAGQLSLSRLWLFVRAYVRLHVALLALAAYFVWGRFRRRELGLLGRYLLTAYAVAATCARQGSGQIYFIEAIALTCVAAGAAIGKLYTDAGRRPWRVAIVLALAVGLLEEARHRREWPSMPTATQRRESSALLQKLKALGPPILSEYNGMVLQAGGELLFQPYAFKMLWAKGRWDDQRIVRDIRDRKFSAVVVDTVNRGRWTPRMYQALESAYGVEGDYWLYRHIGATRVQLLVRRGAATRD